MIDNKLMLVVGPYENQEPANITIVKNFVKIVLLVEQLIAIGFILKKCLISEINYITLKEIREMPRSTKLSWGNY